MRKTVFSKLYVIGLIMLATLVAYPQSALSAQRRPTAGVTTSSDKAKIAKARDKERARLKKQKEKQRKQQLKEKEKRQKEQQKLKAQKQKEEAKRTSSSKKKAQGSKTQSSKQKAQGSKAQGSKSKAQGSKTTVSKAESETAVVETPAKVATESENKSMSTESKEKKVAAKSNSNIKATTVDTIPEETSTEEIATVETQPSKEKAKKETAKKEPKQSKPQAESSQKKTKKSADEEPVDKQLSSNHDFAHEWKPKHVIGLGVGGGLASWLPQTTNVNWPASRPANMGYDGLGELTYTLYFMNEKNFGVGVHIGAGAGYTSSGQKVYYVEQQPGLVDALGHTIDYTITAAEIREQNSALMVTVPVMLALRQDNFYFNLGVKAMLPLNGKYKQTLGETTIDAYYTEFDVHVPGTTATGLIADAEKQQSGKWNASKFNLLVGGELGYYIPIGDYFRLGLGLYGNYCVYSMFKNTPATNLFTISGVGVSPTSANISVGRFSETFTKSNGFFDVGAKISFNVEL